MATSRNKNPLVVTPEGAEPQSLEVSTPAATGPEPFRILTLDGGPAALLVILMLTELEELVPGFLEKVDLIAGTSAGAISGLMLSTKANPAYMLPVAENFWLNEQNYYKNSPFGLLRALVGMGAFNNPVYVQEFLQQRGVLAARKLKDLAKKVVVTTFQVNPAHRTAGQRGPLNWEPKVFHNLTTDGHDLEVAAVDAALSSSASPIVTPIHEGDVDGGLAANNPAMVAITQVLRSGSHKLGDKKLPKDRHGIVMLSLGGGRAHELLDVQNNNWGYLPWLLNPTNPLLLLNAFLTASTEVVTFEAAQMLDRGKFFRLDPFYTETGLLPFVQADPKKQQQTAAATGTQDMIQEAARWLNHSGWMLGHPARMAAGA